MLKTKNMFKNISVLLLIACVVLPSIAQQHPKLPKGISLSCPIARTTRRRTELLLNDTSQSDPHLARHHVIPATRLIEFFNTSLRNSNYFNDYHESRGLLTILSSMADHTLEFYQSHTTMKIKNKTMNLLKILNETVRYKDLEYIESPYNPNKTQEVMNQLFVWMPFNIFEGPHLLRSDDPGHEFEHLALPIIGQELFDELTTIDNEITSYLGHATVERFDRIVLRLGALISKHTWHLTTYNSSKWEKEKNGKYHIKKENQYRSLKRKREINEEYNLDPYCFLTEQFLIDHGDEIYNVSIVGKAFDRAWNGEGFYQKNYDSWKHWYDKSHWCRRLVLPQRGIIEFGRSMVSDDGKPYGYKFNDGSFAVGIIGDDVKYGNDNWKTLQRSDWGTGDEYAGQIFFDKNGQPVALVISNFRNGLVGSGCSFIYNNGNWEYESKDDWHERRFADSTLSLDSHAPRFLIDNKIYIETSKYSYEL